MMKDTGKPREELLKWAGTENELKRVRAGLLGCCCAQQRPCMLSTLHSPYTADGVHDDLLGWRWHSCIHGPLCSAPLQRVQSLGARAQLHERAPEVA